MKYTNKEEDMSILALEVIIEPNMAKSIMLLESLREQKRDSINQAYESKEDTCMYLYAEMVAWPCCAVLLL
jgi:hypothetical protein